MGALRRAEWKYSTRTPGAQCVTGGGMTSARRPCVICWAGGMRQKDFPF